ncbi:MAG: ABC-F family ATP-binding cassette domain-containing protein [Prevotellaceae bacterium]|jgi:ATP-binding cassette subfamily F protein uup|nr:ABC-F family ATP-binding cassette domain-containing protein [Prevotellaceae bacterium]
MIPYLQAENLSKSFGDLTLFDNLKLSVGEGQRVAIVAKNGAGKTTLLNIIAGRDTPDEGSVTFRRGLRVGFLEQLDGLPPEMSVLQAVFASDSPAAKIVREYEQALLEGRDAAALSAQMDAHRAWGYEQRAKQILTQLRVTEFDRRIGELSGGQRKRVALAGALINEPDFLILDEPTNHLDIDMVEWLEGYLSKSRSTLLMVTHDRYFLDRVCSVILEIDRQQLFTYRGNFSYFLEKRQERIDAFNTEVERASNLFRRELEWIRRQPSARGTKIKSRVNAFDEVKERAHARRQDGQVEISVRSSRLGKKIIEAKNLCKAYDGTAYVSMFSYEFKRGEKVGITGKNGAGKTTLLNLLAGNLRPDSGHVSHGETVVVGYYRQEGIAVADGKRVIDVARDIAEYVKMGDGKNLSTSQFLNHFLFPPGAQQTLVSKLSGGERRRLYLLTILMRQPNFLILDEPTNDLDLMTMAVLEDYLREFEGCVIIVSHDRYFMDKIVDHLFVFEDVGKIKDFPGSYTDYRLYRQQQERLRQHTGQKVAEKPAAAERKKSAPERRKLSFAERREYELLPSELKLLESEKAELEQQLSSGLLSPQELTAKSQRIGEIISALEAKELRWLELDEIAELRR